MANWGSQRVASLDVPPSAILASFLHALAWKQEIVAFEVILAVRRLVTKYISSSLNSFFFFLFSFLFFSFLSALPVSKKSLRIKLLTVRCLVTYFSHSLTLLPHFLVFLFFLFPLYLLVCIRYGPDLSMEWDLVLLILDKIHDIIDSHENNLFAVLKETVITIEGNKKLIAEKKEGERWVR
jgi:hypothetical protein